MILPDSHSFNSIGIISRGKLSRPLHFEIFQFFNLVQEIFCQVSIQEHSLVIFGKGRMILIADVIPQCKTVLGICRLTVCFLYRIAFRIQIADLRHLR